MSVSLSVAEVLASLEAKMELHRRKEIHHAEQEAFHREQRALHLAELENATRHYEAFRGVASSAAEVAASMVSAASAPPQPKEEEMPAADTPALRSRLVVRAAKERPAGQPFNSSDLAAEVNRRFAKALKRPIDARLASAALRRLADNGVLRVVRQGGARHQTLYARA